MHQFLNLQTSHVGFPDLRTRCQNFAKNKVTVDPAEKRSIKDRPLCKSATFFRRAICNKNNATGVHLCRGRGEGGPCSKTNEFSAHPPRAPPSRAYVFRRASTTRCTNCAILRQLCKQRGMRPTSEYKSSMFMRMGAHPPANRWMAVSRCDMALPGFWDVWESAGRRGHRWVAGVTWRSAPHGRLFAERGPTTRLLDRRSLRVCGRAALKRWRAGRFDVCDVIGLMLKIL